MLDTLTAIIDAIDAFVFAKIMLFGVNMTVIVLFIAVAMVFFTAWLGFPNVRHLWLSVRIVSGKMAKADDPGEMTQFQALSTALSGTVGLGNIAGVALAISTGGPGAAFWIFIIGWFAMTLKMAPCTR